MKKLRRFYVYVWADSLSGEPFYVGVGTHTNGIKHQTKYARAYRTHYTDSSKLKLAYCQLHANALKNNNNPHTVEIIYDNLTLEERIKYESELISLYGRRSEGDGVLCNITAGGDENPMHNPAIRAKHAEIMKTIINIPTITPEFRENNRIVTYNNMHNLEYRAKWDAIFLSAENIEKLRACNSRSKTINFGGVEYRSISELSRHLGISKTLLMYRIKHGIPLDSTPYRGNKFSTPKGPAKNKESRKCTQCGIVKSLVDFGAYYRGSNVHHTKICTSCNKDDLTRVQK